MSRLALGGILGMVSVRLVVEASEAGLVLVAAFLHAFPPGVLFGVDMASGAGLGAVLRREDLRGGGLVDWRVNGGGVDNWCRHGVFRSG